MFDVNPLEAFMYGYQPLGPSIERLPSPAGSGPTLAEPLSREMSNCSARRVKFETLIIAQSPTSNA